MVAWSLTRVLQSWSGIYASRQLLGVTLLLQGAAMEAPLFIPMGIILLYLLVEILPMLFVLDHRFVASVTESALGN